MKIIIDDKFAPNISCDIYDDKGKIVYLKDLNKKQQSNVFKYLLMFAQLFSRATMEEDEL